ALAHSWLRKDLAAWVLGCLLASHAVFRPSARLRPPQASPKVAGWSRPPRWATPVAAPSLPCPFPRRFASSYCRLGFLPSQSPRESARPRDILAAARRAD